MSWIAKEIGRARILFGSAEAGPAPPGPVFLAQVHGATVVDAVSARDTRPEADALVTDVPDVVCAVRTADCAPVVLVAGNGDVIGLVHAGWKGLRDGVVQATAAALRERSDAPVHAVLGPCIRPAHYEFGEPHLSELAHRYGDTLRAATAAGAPALDLPAAVRAALAEAGSADLDDVGIDTFTSSAHHSWRRDHRDERNCTYAWIVP